jgi:PAS domain S-box-containing protein
MWEQNVPILERLWYNSFVEKTPILIPGGDMEICERPTGEHVQTILDSITDGVLTVDLGFRITSLNRAGEEIIGIPRERAVGRPCCDVFKAGICEEGCILKQAIRTEKPVVNMPVYIIRGDLRRIPISVNAALLRDAQGRVIGGVETFRDLTVVNDLRRRLLKQHSFGDIISKNRLMQRIFSILPQIAESNSTVLIEGASGTGKELVARAIHNNSPRRKGPFVAVNCGALPIALCESELFGYKAGAFTDAKKDKPGRFDLAQNGSIFLDEVGDLDLTVQMRLLRVLEERVYDPLGATKTVKTNARVIAATNRNLGDFVRGGRFREDLYFRINVIKLALPTLSERLEDIPLLVDHFIHHFNQLNGKRIVGISHEAMAALMLAEWPGNVRELENAVEHAFVLCQGEWIELQHLPERFIPRNGGVLVPTGLTLQEIEKRAIEHALQRNQWKKVATACELGIDKNTLRRKISRHGINRTVTNALSA